MRIKGMGGGSDGGAGGGVSGRGGLGGPGLGMAMEFGASVVGFVIVGFLIDKWAGTTPLWTLILAGLGFVGGGYNFIRQALAVNKRLAEAYKRDHAGVKRDAGRPDGSAAQGMFDRRIVEIEEDDDDRGNGGADGWGGGKWDDDPDGFRD